MDFIIERVTNLSPDTVDISIQKIKEVWSKMPTPEWFAMDSDEEISEIMDEQSVDACYHSENDGQQDGKPAGKLCTLKVFAAIIVLLSLGGMPAW